MMKSNELRAKARESLKGKYWMALVVSVVVGTLISIGTVLLNCAEHLMNALNMVEPSEMDSTMELGSKVLIGFASVFVIVGSLISIFVGNAAMVGLCNYFIKNTDSKPSFKDGFSGFTVKYGRNTGTILLMGIRITLWCLLLIIPGIIKTYEYAIVPYILADDPEISATDALAKSKQMMKGNKWRLFKLELSFIGWYVLCGLTLGIGVYFLTPYLEAAAAEFYVELKNKQA